MKAKLLSYNQDELVNDKEIQNVAKKIGKILRDERERQGIDIIDLDIYSGVSKDTISRIESGEIGNAKKVIKVGIALIKHRQYNYKDLIYKAIIILLKELKN